MDRPSTRRKGADMLRVAFVVLVAMVAWLHVVVTRAAAAAEQAEMNRRIIEHIRNLP